MYLGQTRRVDRRKPAKCSQCEEEILAGSPCIVVVRNAKSKKGKEYLWTIYVHLDCFIPWTVAMREKRALYTAGRKGGRPLGSRVQALQARSPELAKERHQCIRTRARLMRYILASSNPTRILNWSGRVATLDRRIKEILPLVCSGRRTRADAARIEEVVRESEPSPHETAMRKKAAREAENGL